MKIKFILLIGLLGFLSAAYSQKRVLYEQIAFKFYKDSILRNYISKEKLPISLKVQEDCSYWNIECLKEFNLKINDTAAAAVSAIGTEDLDLENDTRFKVVKFKRNRFPMVFATSFLSFDSDQYVTAIVETYKDKFITYLFEINKEGVIRKWCKGEIEKE